jgi:hypothetical protein
MQNLRPASKAPWEKVTSPLLRALNTVLHVIQAPLTRFRNLRC